MKLLTASWVVPVSRPPIADGAVVMQGGRILDVGQTRELKARWPGAETTHFEETALLPALLNCHAHLELTGLGSPPQGLTFTGWLKEIIRRKGAASEDDFAASVGMGAEECLRTGQGVVLDVVSRPSAALAHPHSPLRFFKAAEVICASEQNAEAALRAAASLLAPSGAESSGYFLHSPYTVCQSVFLQGARESIRIFGRYFTHIAESAEEVEYCLTGRGAIGGDLYRGLPVDPPPPPGKHPLEWLDGLGLVDCFSVLVHGVRLDPSHISLVAERGASVVLCPRSNRNLGVGAAPGLALADAGVRIGLGTDSALSAGDLDLWQEVVAAVEVYGFSPLQAVRAATLGGAEVLGVEAQNGALSPGYRADILALRLGAGRDLGERLLLGGHRERVA